MELVKELHASFVSQLSQENVELMTAIEIQEDGLSSSIPKKATTIWSETTHQCSSSEIQSSSQISFIPRRETLRLAFNLLKMHGISGPSHQKLSIKS